MADAASSEPVPREDVAESDVPAADEADDSLIEDLRDLAGDTRTAVEAEIAFQKERASYVAGAARGIAIRFAIAALLAVIALCTLAIGVLVGLTPLIGPWLATAAVVGVLAVVAVTLALSGRNGIRRVQRVAFPPEPKP